MKYSKQRRSRLARAIVANAVVCLFAFLVFAGQMTGRPDYRHQVDSGIISLFDGLSCDPHSDDAGTDDSHKHLSKCCVLCASCRTADTSPQFVEAMYQQAGICAAPPLSNVDYDLPPSHKDGPSAWISSRSPRGPPTLS